MYQNVHLNPPTRIAFFKKKKNTKKENGKLRSKREENEREFQD
jgi:hypothetical protein